MESATKLVPTTAVTAQQRSTKHVYALLDAVTTTRTANVTKSKQAVDESVQVVSNHDLAFPRSENTLLLARSGYEELATLAHYLHDNQILLSRGMSCAQSPLVRTYHDSKKKIASFFGRDYIVPDLRETVQLQLAHVRQYGACINEILNQTTQEINATHTYVRELATDVIKYSRAQQDIAHRLHESNTSTHPSQLLETLPRVAQANTATKLELFLEQHDLQTKNQLKRGDLVVAQRAAQRKSEYLRHAYAVELLLVGSLATAKKIAVDAGCYASMLDRLASAYFNLGCNAQQLREIIGGLETMQRFTGNMQSSVAQGLQRLDKALIQTKTTIGPQLESAAYQLR